MLMNLGLCRGALQDYCSRYGYCRNTRHGGCGLAAIRQLKGCCRKRVRLEGRIGSWLFDENSLVFLKVEDLGPGARVIGKRFICCYGLEGD